MKLLSAILPIVAALACCAPAAVAQPERVHTTDITASHDFDHKHLMLIVNSNYEDEPWANAMAQPVLLRIAQIDSIESDFISLNNTLIKNREAFDRVSDNLFETYAERHPSYVVLIGSFSFNLRDRIKQEWGDVPILLLTRLKEYSEIDDYFSKDSDPFDFGMVKPLSDCREDYNFTLIYMPDYYQATIDEMVRLKPEIEKLVLLSDDIYVNRRLAQNISIYMKGKYPHLEFEWLVADASTADNLQQLMANEHPEIGLLLSTWAYERVNALGQPELTSTDLRLMSGSKNPIFSMRDAYRTHGALGGVYSDGENIDDRITEVIDQMLRGKSMREIKFYLNERPLTKYNYRLLKRFGLDGADFEGDVMFVNKPQSYIEKNIVWICIVVFIILLIMTLLAIKNRTQKRQILVLNKNRHFINSMPVPYATAVIRYNQTGEVEKMDYTSMNDAFSYIIEKNTTNDKYLLFPHDFFRQKVEEMNKKKGTISFTYHFDKTDTYYDFLMCPLDDSGRRRNESKLDIFAQEITARHKMEVHLKRLAEKLNLTLEIAKVVPWQIDVKTNVIIFRTYSSYIHRYGKAFVEYADEEGQEIEVPFSEYIQAIIPEDRSIMIKNHEDACNNRIQNFYAQYRTHSDSDPDAVEWIEIIGAVTDKDENGRPTKITGAVQVITERKEQEAEMEHAIERANESDRMKSAFLANMSHEIRTPLNAIVGFSNLMATIQDENERAEFADIINRNNDLLLNLINDVLDFAKIESNTIDFNYTNCNVNDIVHSVKQTMQMRIPKEVRFNEIMGAGELYMYTDSNRLAQLLINLIANACKFTSKGNITFGYELRGDDKVYFFVKDSGIGISPDKQKSIFERFVKINTFVQGTGLGLSICKSIVERMGGEIGVISSGEGKGSTFWFVLPRGEEKKEASADNADSQENGAANAPHRSLRKFLTGQKSKEGEKPKMLLAEDNLSNYKLMDHLLQSQFDITWVKNGAEAVEAFENGDFDIILLDISMPVMDGYEALREIRKTDAKIPIIAVTAYAYASDRKRMLDSGFDAYVSKPISYKALKEAIQQVINKK